MTLHIKLTIQTTRYTTSSVPLYKNYMLLGLSYYWSFPSFFIPSLCHLLSLLRILLTILLLSYIPVFLVPFSSLPAVLTDLYTPVLPFVCILSFPSFSVPIPFSVSYQHSFFCTFSSIYILFSCQSSYCFCVSLFICFSFLSFCFLFSLPLLTQFVCIRVFLFFFCLCQSLPLYPPTTHVSSCGNVSICIRKVPTSNLCQNTIMTEKTPSIFRVVDYANNRPLGCDTL
jgi:hypothetical protein